MSHYLAIIFATVLANNFVLNQFLGLCPFIGVSKKSDAAIGMGLATMFVMCLSASITWIIDHYILVPFNLEFLRTISFIVSIAVLVSITELFIAKTSALLQQLLGIYLPLITTNCIVLGLTLLNSKLDHSFLEANFYALGAALGFFLVLVIFLVEAVKRV